MRAMILAFCLAVLLGSTMTTPAFAATPAEIADQVRANWAQARAGYLAAIKPYKGTAEYGPLLTQYTAALNKTGNALDQYLALKLANPPATPEQLTPVVDQMIKNMSALRTLNGKASGPLVNILGTALSQHSLAAQTALKNMR